MGKQPQSDPRGKSGPFFNKIPGNPDIVGRIRDTRSRKINHPRSQNSPHTGLVNRPGGTFQAKIPVGQGGGPGPDHLGAGQQAAPVNRIRVARDFIEKWSGLSPRIRLGLFPHSPYTCSSNTLKKAKALALEKAIPFFIHLAETREEVALVQGQTGLTPVRYIHRLGCLDASFVGVHVNYPDQEEMALLAGAGARVSHCPESNMKLGAGVTPVVDLLARGIVVGLGTDGCAGNNDLDLFREMGTAARLHKVHRLDPTLLEAHSVLEMATLKAAEVLGLEKEIGSLEVGKQADLILINLDQPHLIPLYHPFSHLVYAASGADVDTVFVAGQMVMRQRKLLTLDWEEIRERVIAISREIRMLSLGTAGVGARSAE